MGALMGPGENCKSLTKAEIQSIENVLAANTFKVTVGDDWTDDHIACCDFTIKTQGMKKPIEFSLWWIDRRVMGWAEGVEDSPTLRKKFIEYMKEAIKDALDDAEE